LRRLPLKSTGCYTFAASQGRFGFTPGLSLEFHRQDPEAPRVHDPIAAGRRSALRAVALQAAASVAVALVFLLQGPAHALAAGWGGAAMVAGNALAARLALGGGIGPAAAAFGRLVLAVLAKWLVALAGFAIGLGVWRLPPLPMLVGLAAGLLAYLLALNVGRLKLGHGVERER
jgi:F0F1-type ATP synthase assembly protein I